MGANHSIVLLPPSDTQPIVPEVGMPLGMTPPLRPLKEIPKMGEVNTQAQPSPKWIWPKCQNLYKNQAIHPASVQASTTSANKHDEARYLAPIPRGKEHYQP